GHAWAHIMLLQPPSWTQEGSGGDPQKAEPCGGEGGTPTGVVSKFRPGQTITVQWQETIYHAGHFRIRFATHPTLRQDPKVYVDNQQYATNADISDPPQPPVLLDNLFPRTDPFGNPGTVFEQKVTLPNMLCDKCTLQVIQFMLGHGPPNYIYHHCADIQLTNDAPADAGVLPPSDGGVVGGGGSGGSAGGGGSGGTMTTGANGGCSLAATTGSVGGAWLLLAVVAIALRRRAPTIVGVPQARNRMR